jgi:hypothetical protein
MTAEGTQVKVTVADVKRELNRRERETRQHIREAARVGDVLDVRGWDHEASALGSFRAWIEEQER